MSENDGKSDFYVRPRGRIVHNSCKPQNTNKSQKALRRALRRLSARRAEFEPESSGGHECHKPGSMKKSHPLGRGKR